MCVYVCVGTGSVASTPSATQLQAMDIEVNEEESEAESESGNSDSGESEEEEEEEEDETLTPYDRAAKRIKVWRYWPPRDVLYAVDKSLVTGGNLL